MTTRITVPFFRRNTVAIVLRTACFAMLLFVGYYSNPVYAQSRDDRNDKYKERLRADSLLLNRRRNVIKSDVLGVLVGYYNVTFERLARVAPRSLVVTAEYAVFSYEEFEFKGTSIQPALRYYLTKKREPPAGYYAELFMIYSDYKVYDTSQGYGARINQLGGGIHGGIQWVIAERITIDVFLGGVYVETSVKGYLNQDAIRSFQVVTGVNAGFRF